MSSTASLAELFFDCPNADCRSGFSTDSTSSRSPIRKSEMLGSTGAFRRLFGRPPSILPERYSSAAVAETTDGPIHGVVGPLLSE